MIKEKKSHTNIHIPVLLYEMLDKLSPQDGETYIDATFGAGGYTKAILDATNNAVLHVIDRDISTKKYYEEIQKQFKDRKIFFHNINFSLMSQLNIEVDGIIMDIGMSSMQIDEAKRGFSFMKEGPLRMTMDNSTEIDAEYIINYFREEKIEEIIRLYGEERQSKAIAKKIIEERKKKHITTTIELANIIRSVYPKRNYYKIDPATKSFQALRIFINSELTELEEGIESASKILKPNGRLIIVSFHGLEDRVIKSKFKSLCARIKQDGEKEKGKKKFSFLNKKAIQASRVEVKKNRRSRSAKLRSIIRVNEIEENEDKKNNKKNF